MEDAEHDLRETLEDTMLYFATRGIRGTRAQLQVKSDNAAASSYKSIFYAEFTEDAGREILGAAIKEHYIRGLQMTLYCEPYWHPASTTNLVNVVTVYNHDDGGVNHDNFVDIAAANIAGDVPAKTRVLIDGADSDNLKWIMMARRSQGTPSNFDHWWEAEDATAQSNWADDVDTTRSNGNIVSDSANASGYVIHSGIANLNHFKGSFRIYASLWTDDIVNTQIRAQYGLGLLGARVIGKWQKLTRASTWQLIYLTSMTIGGELYPPGQSLADISVRIDYEKDASDAVKCDYIMLLPVDESVVQLEGIGDIDGVGSDSDMILDGAGDFEVVCILDDASNYSGRVTLKGAALTLQPGTNNRLFFKWLCTTVSTDDPFNDHVDAIDNDASPPTRAAVTLDYLPQFISPLE